MALISVLGYVFRYLKCNVIHIVVYLSIINTSQVQFLKLRNIINQLILSNLVLLFILLVDNIALINELLEFMIFFLKWSIYEKRYDKSTCFDLISLCNLNSKPIVIIVLLLEWSIEITIIAIDILFVYSVYVIVSIKQIAEISSLLLRGSVYVTCSIVDILVVTDIHVLVIQPVYLKVNLILW